MDYNGPMLKARLNLILMKDLLYARNDRSMDDGSPNTASQHNVIMDRDNVGVDGVHHCPITIRTTNKWEKVMGTAAVSSKIDAYTLKRRFMVITSDTRGALNVKRVVERLDPYANVMRLGCRLDFWTEESKIDTRTFRTMSQVTHAMVIDKKKEKKEDVQQIQQTSGDI